MKGRNFVKTSGYSLGAVGLASLVSTQGYAQDTTVCEMEDQKAGTYDIDEYTLKAGLTQAEKDAIKAAFNGAANQAAVDTLIRDKERDGTFTAGGDKEEGDLMVSTCKKYGTKEITPSSAHTRTQTTTVIGNKLTITTIWRTRLAMNCDGKEVADADDTETKKPKTPKSI